MHKVVTITSQAWNVGPEGFNGVYESSYLIKMLEEGWFVKKFKMTDGSQRTWTFVLEKDENNQTIQQINS